MHGAGPGDPASEANSIGGRGRSLVEIAVRREYRRRGRWSKSPGGWLWVLKGRNVPKLPPIKITGKLYPIRNRVDWLAVRKRVEKPS